MRRVLVLGLLVSLLILSFLISGGMLFSLWALPQPDVVGYWRMDFYPGFNLVAFPVLPDTPTLESVLGEPPGRMEIFTWDRQLNRLRDRIWNEEERQWEGDLYILHRGIAYWVWWGGRERWSVIVTGRPEADIRFYWYRLGLGWRYFAPTGGREIELSQFPPSDPRDILLKWASQLQQFTLAWGSERGWIAPFFSAIEPDKGYIVLLHHPEPRLVGPPLLLESLYERSAREVQTTPLPTLNNHRFHLPPHPLVVGNTQGLAVCYPDGNPCGGDFRLLAVRENLVENNGQISINEEIVQSWDISSGGAPEGRFKIALTVSDQPNYFRSGDRVFLRVLTRRGEETRSESFIIPEDDWLINDLDFPHPLISATDEKLVPNAFSVSSPFPNPFNQRVRIDVTLPSTGLVLLTFYDTEGRVVWQKKEFLSRGEHRLSIEPSGLPSGVYLLLVTWHDSAQSFKLALVR